jgi:hypothetical protein
VLQAQLEAQQAELAASKAAAAAQLQQKTKELDGMKSKLVSERAANKRQTELSAEVGAGPL